MAAEGAEPSPKHLERNLAQSNVCKKSVSTFHVASLRIHLYFLLRCG